MENNFSWDSVERLLKAAFEQNPERMQNLIAKNEEQYVLRFLNVKLCPFCNSEPQIVTETTVFKNLKGGIDWDQIYYGVSCSNTTCWIADNQEPQYHTVEEAVDMWNNRNFADEE